VTRTSRPARVKRCSPHNWWPRIVSALVVCGGSWKPWSLIGSLRATRTRNPARAARLRGTCRTRARWQGSAQSSRGPPPRPRPTRCRPDHESRRVRTPDTRRRRRADPYWSHLSATSDSARLHPPLGSPMSSLPATGSHHAGHSRAATGVHLRPPAPGRYTRVSAGLASRGRSCQCARDDLPTEPPVMTRARRICIGAARQMQVTAHLRWTTTGRDF
jgi:hypothetical protein